jgi:hypothetical protein
MKIKIQNMYISPAINLLQGMKLKGKNSRARSKFVKKLSGALKELQESQHDLLVEYSELDANGEPIIENEKYKLKKGQKGEYTKEFETLSREEAEIEGGTYTGHLADCQKILDAYDEELSGQDAEVYDVLLDALEEGTK